MTGPVRPTGLLRPTRPTAQPAATQASPMAGQPSMEEMLQFLMLMLAGQGQGVPMQGAPMPAQQPQAPMMPMGGMGQ